MPLPAHTARIPYKTINGHEIHLEAWLPETASAPVPVLAWIHGGGFFDGAAGDCSEPNLLPTLDRGWAFVSLEYRLVPQVTLPDLIQDIKDACEFIRSGKLDEALGGGKVDGKRLAVSGASAGGTLALLASYTLTPPPSVVSVLYPAANITHPSYTAPLQFPSGPIPHSEVSHFLSLDGPIVSHAPANVDFATMVAKDRTRACFWAVQEGLVSELATRTTDPEELKQFVAKTHVKKGVTPPTVIIHGGSDVMVPFETSEELLEVLEKEGVESRLIKAEGENHGFDLVPGVLEVDEKKKWFEEANDFVEKYL